MNLFLRRAIELALENVREGGQPFGAVLVKDGEVISEGVNEMHKKHDVSGHAELLAIRKAQEKLQRIDLSDCTIYASGHPCAMCLTSMYFSGITDIYYTASLADCEKVGLKLSGEIYADLKKGNKDRKVVMKHIPLEKSMEDPMKLWKERKIKP